MYKIIGADGKEYGPVAVEQLRQWIAEGRLNAQTQAQPEGATDWKPLAAYPEFAGTFGGATTAPPPLPGAVNAERFTAEMLGCDYQLGVGSCVGRGWELVKANFWLLVGASFVINLLNQAIGILFGPLMGGLSWLNLKLVRGESAEFGDSFAGFSRGFLQLFLAGIVILLLGTLGLLACLIPGIYLFVSWVFAFPLIIDQNMEFWPAMELSRKKVGQHWWTIFGLALLSGLLTILGLVCCFVGVFVTGPIVTAAWMYAYEDIFGRRAA